MFWDELFEKRQNKWQKELRNNIRSIGQLQKYIDLTKEEKKLLPEILKIHPMNITRYYLSLIDKINPQDAIRKMCIPCIQELDDVGSYDPSNEASNIKTEGLQHKYPPTALVLLTNVCTMYCRYCFRKRMVGLSNKETLKIFKDAIFYIKKHPEINNVLISGGDPLTLPTKIIKNILKELCDITQLKLIRIGTRTPVVFPDRILKDKSLLGVLKQFSLKDRRIYIVTHFNHPKEITSDSIKAINKLIKANTILNNQAVLLKGVNDGADILAELMNKLAAIGVTPYYLFQCRPVKRVKNHFQVPLHKAVRLIEEAKKQMHGLAKRFRFCMSHAEGKIVIIRAVGDIIHFAFHQAKNPENAGKFFSRKLGPEAAWLDENLN